MTDMKNFYIRMNDQWMWWAKAEYETMMSLVSKTELSQKLT